MAAPDLARARWVVAKVEATDGRGLSMWELHFVDGLAQRLETYGERTALTARQADVLEQIARKVAG